MSSFISDKENPGTESHQMSRGQQNPRENYAIYFPADRIAA
jgi:hypothetical protein